MTFYKNQCFILHLFFFFFDTFLLSEHETPAVLTPHDCKREGVFRMGLRKYMYCHVHTHKFEYSVAGDDLANNLNTIVQDCWLN